MKKLYIIRHAKSSWSDTLLSDFDRPLNDRGEKDAPLMGDILKKARVLPDLIISSPAKRALKTAKIIGEKIGYPKNKIEKNSEIYHAGMREMLRIINEVNNDVKSLMIFGHNPAFTHLVNILTDFDLDNLPTCGVVEIDLPVSDWQAVAPGTGKVINCEYPKKYK